MADNALKTPLIQTITGHINRRGNDFSQVSPKGIPCSVTAIDKDIVTVKFEGSNGVWNMPTMKMSQAISPYGRDPTQVGDKGYASPADYYVGGISGLGGGSTNFTPRGNLTPLIFHPMAQAKSEARDYDQLTHAGGPSGVKIIQQAKQPKNDQTPAPTPQELRKMLGWGRRSRQAWADRPVTLDDTSDQQQDNRSYLEIDKNGRHALRSVSGKHSAVIDEASRKIALRVPAESSNVWVGGNGVNGALYGPMLVATPMGLMVTTNSKAKWQQSDEADELKSASPPAQGGDGGGANP